MRLLGLILGMVMMSTSSQSETRNFYNCIDIKREMNLQLRQYSDLDGLRSRIPAGQLDNGLPNYQTDQHKGVTQIMERTITLATQLATIYIAKC